MKKILIYQENTEPLELFDNDDTDKEVYAANLSKILSAQSITILITSHFSAIVRPSKITSIRIGEEQNHEDRITNEHQVVTPNDEEEIEEDVITDAD